MPCNSDHLEQSGREAAIQQAAQLYYYACLKLPYPCPEWVVNEAKNYYASADKVIPMLCTLIRGMTEEQINRVVYNARDPMSRRLADWWDVHLEIDRRREEKEKAEKRLTNEYGPKSAD